MTADRQEGHAEAVDRLPAKKRRIVRVAAGQEPADLVLKNADHVNVFSDQLCRGDIAVAEGIIAGVGCPCRGAQELDLTGSLVLPGLLDAHVHLESAMAAPGEFARAVLPHGTTTVVAGPHESANVMGAGGIAYMLQATEALPVIPALRLTTGGAFDVTAQRYL